MHYRARLGATLAVVGTIAGCGSDRSPATRDEAGAKETPAAVTVAANDFSFEAPDHIPAGATTFRLTNHGKELHQAQLVKLEDGKTLEDLTRAFKHRGPLPAWVKFVGGPNGVAPGQETSATSVLAPGQYAYLCWIPSPDGIMHVIKGMVRPFEVTAPSPAAASELPKPDVTVKLVDHDFQPSPALTPGKHTIMVENAGSQPHELVLLKMAPGKKVEDFAHWAEGGLKGPPPAEALGGVVFLDPGSRGTFEVELTAGDYGLICFFPDTKDGKPHLAHGMMKTIKVPAST
jgi:uncharacterized cupredoxin-like copper-binding protein